MTPTICWIRRDLRLHDHAALSAALSQGPTTIVFVFDRYILDKLRDKDDRRITFIMDSLKEIEVKLQSKGSSITILCGHPEEEIPKLARALKTSVVYTNRDYEPYAKKRDQMVGSKLKSFGIEFIQSKDSVFFEKEEIQTNSGEIYKVFTPYKNKWHQTFEQTERNVPDFKCLLKNLRRYTNPNNVLAKNWYSTIGFVESDLILKAGTNVALKRLKDFGSKIDDYKEARNFPANPGTSLLSVYLRFGNISVRDMVRASLNQSSTGASTWLSEIIWRDFYQTILDAFPHVEKGSFKPQYDKIKFLGTEAHFQAWTKGLTGFPIVDAAMRCLNETGTMHNRLRMIVASFLCKILLVDWKKGEAYFAQKLLDFDLAANNGGWQWSSSSGCDAQPYFRIFNPYTQSTNFDAEGVFIKSWVPELKDLLPKQIHRPELSKLTPNYPVPIVSYEKNRERCLVMYSVVKSKA